MRARRVTRRPRWLPLAVLALPISGSCRAPEAIQSSLLAPPGPEARLAGRDFPLGPNDVLRVSVFGHPELSTPLIGSIQGTRVDGEGFLSLPLIGAVRVDGLALSDARVVITAAYARYVKEPRLDVSVTEYAARRFYVYGEIEHPGAYVFDRPLSLYQGLTVGGGFRPGANRRSIWLVRDVGPSLEAREIDGESLERGGLVALLPDDLVYVPRTGASRFKEEVLPYISGVASTAGTIATFFLLGNND